MSLNANEVTEMIAGLKDRKDLEALKEEDVKAIVDYFCELTNSTHSPTKIR